LAPARRTLQVVKVSPETADTELGGAWSDTELGGAWSGISSEETSSMTTPPQQRVVSSSQPMELAESAAAAPVRGSPTLRDVLRNLLNENADDDDEKLKEKLKRLASSLSPEASESTQNASKKSRPQQQHKPLDLDAEDIDIAALERMQQDAMKELERIENELKRRRQNEKKG